MATLTSLRHDVLDRLGDLWLRTIWTEEEVDRYLHEAQMELAQVTRAVIDWTYLENLPRGFSYTAAWEKQFGHVAFDYGLANFNYDFERVMLTESRRVGPAGHTCPYEATEGFTGDDPIPATADLPADTFEIERAAWDENTIQALSPRDAAELDSRYHVTEGEVYAFMWKYDGVRTIRKVRVPAEPCSTYDIEGSWGCMRDPTDLYSSGVTGDWGVPRRIPDFHAIGPYRFGLPRRPYHESKNFKVERYRQAVPLDILRDGELPTRYAYYLRLYALSKCLGRNGPGQQPELAAMYAKRWDAAIKRVLNRVHRNNFTRTGRMGGSRPTRTRPPRPRLPWNYGSIIR